MGHDSGTERISTRGLGRALLARQHLVDRTARPTVDLVARLVALQSQNPSSAYLALHARAAGFVPADLAGPLLDRRVARLALLRDTVHLASAQDARWLWSLLAPVLRRHLVTGSQVSRDLRDVDLDDLRSAALDLFTAGPQTSAALGARLADRWPQVPPRSLAMGARGTLPLVQVTPRGVWGRSLATTWLPAWDWFGAGPDDALLWPAADPGSTDPAALLAARADLVRRYLAAFGPASVADVQQWSGLTRLAAAVDLLRPELVEVVHTDPPGGRPRVLLDLPDAPRPSADLPVPVRLLPDFDNLLLGHADRTRVVPAQVRPALASRNGMPPGTVLVDGLVSGTWTLHRERLPRAGGAPQARREAARLTVTPLRRLTRDEQRAVREESQVLARFVAEDAAEHTVQVAPGP